MTQKYDYDLITVGAGSGGVAATRRAASYGAKTAICENSRVGGTCVIRGCVPKKLFVYASEFSGFKEDMAGFGWSVDGASHSWAKLMANKDTEIDRLNGIYIKLLKNSGVDLFEMPGHIIDAHTVKMGDQIKTAEKILIATGGHPVVPNIPGKEHLKTSDDIFELDDLPEKILVIGGGYIALEFASIFNGLGRNVHVMIRRDNILRGFDRDLREHLQNCLESRGIHFITNTNPTEIISKNGAYTVKTDTGQNLSFGLIMSATGRDPNVQNLGLKEAKIEQGRKGEIIVNDDSQTSVPSIFAVGDVTDRLALTPVAIREGRRFAEKYFNKSPNKITVDYHLTPKAVFTTPPLSTCGYSEDEAKEKGLSFDVYETTFRPMKNTLSGRDEKTLMKMLVEKDNEKIIGMHMIGPDAPEIIQSLAVAMTVGLTLPQLDATMPLHPSAAEEFVTNGLHLRKD